MAIPASANTIDLSGNSFTFKQGEEMTIQFSVWNYGWHNPGVSPYPTSISLELIGANPANMHPLGASGSYFPGFMLSGRIESLDGAASAPLKSAAAALLGLAAGSLVVTPATLYSAGGSSQVAALEATVSLDLALSEQIFGPDVMSRQSSALIVLRNLGADLTVGAGDGLSLRNAISEPSVTGFGSVQTAGITNRVTLMAVPEPATMALVLLAFAASGLAIWRKRAKNRDSTSLRL